MLIRYSYTFMFFFSSRRRHTRYIGDWSSDVCSSDLCSSPRSRRQASSTSPMSKGELTNTKSTSLRRSEERRVGKECRSRWSPDHLKKKEKIEDTIEEDGKKKE